MLFSKFNYGSLENFELVTSWHCKSFLSIPLFWPISFGKAKTNYNWQGFPYYGPRMRFRVLNPIRTLDIQRLNLSIFSTQLLFTDWTSKWMKYWTSVTIVSYPLHKTIVKVLEWLWKNNQSSTYLRMPLQLWKRKDRSQLQGSCSGSGEGTR